MKREKLSQLLDISIGRTPSRGQSQYWGEGHRWVSIRDMSSKSITRTKEQITDLAVMEARCKLVKKGTLLFSFKLTIGKMAFAGCDLFTNEAIAAFVIKDARELSPDFLYYALQSASYGGSNQAVMGKTLNSKTLAEIEIPFPPLEDQIRIAHLLRKVEELIAQRRQNLHQLDELHRSVFLEMFGDPVRNEKGWTTLPFSQIGSFTSGGTPSKSRADYWAGEYPWVSPKDMKVPRIVNSVDHISAKVFDETSLKLIAPGHLLIVVRGMILAHSFPVAINMVDIAINQDMKAISLKSSMRAEYVFHCLNALKRRILKLVTTAGHGTKKFDSDAMVKLLIPCPPPEMQDRFMVIADRIDQIKTCYQKSLADLEALYGGLSQRVFKGELDLSRVPLSGEATGITEDKMTDVEDIQPMEPFLELSAPDELSVLQTAEGRISILSDWFNAWLVQLGDRPFIAQKFMDAALQRFWDLMEDDTPEWGMAQYEELKSWLFEALEQGRLTQGYDDAKNRVQITAAKG